ncbi:hypothetical protein [Phenylobacterium sp.]|jgi:hypothetical protein|uniref:hypothetical protein n=1 Tax=Phenylobacterium sp. TaxID=1871053 RepID=UPI002F3FF52E
MSGFGLTSSVARMALGAALVGLIASPALAAPAPATTAQRAAQLQALTDCRKVAEPTQRLACYDKAAAALDEAEAKGDVVVVNREQARKVRKQAFGFSLPSISLFERGEKTEDVAATEGSIAEARKLPTGHWQIKLAEGGGTWVQIDSTEIPIDPKVGDHVKIRKASLGSYQMAVGNQREVKVHRVE